MQMSTAQTENSVTSWIHAVRVGDEDSARQLWNRYFDRLMAIARSRMSTLPRATYDEEDAAISTFRVLCKRLQEGGYPELSDRNELWQLMLTVILRKIGHRAQYESAEKRGSLASEFSRVDETLISCPDSSQIAMEYQLLLAKLDDCNLERVAVLKLEGFTNDEIAVKLNRTRRTVQRMLDLIREILRDDFDD
jgi:hypothetical protein